MFSSRTELSPAIKLLPAFWTIKDPIFYPMIVSARMRSEFQVLSIGKIFRKWTLTLAIQLSYYYWSYIWQMYNVFMVNKQKSQEQALFKDSERNHKYVQRYLTKTRPSLIDSYNKRINSFIRRMEEDPIKVNLDHTTKTPKKRHEENQPNHEHQASNQKSKISNDKGVRKRASSNLSWGDKAVNSMTIEQVESLGSHYFQFKFKDNEDFKSLFTPWERLQRKRNYDIFKQKYGDPTIAFRSIGSQSEYKPGHEYRERNKLRQIHPPMKYTHKPTKQVLANIKSRKLLGKNKGKSHEKHRHSQHDTNMNSLQDDDIAIRRNTGSSMSGFNDDTLGMGDTQNNDNVSVGNRSNDGEEHEGPKELRSKDKKSQKPPKLHFKQIMDLQQNITDVKTKKALRDLLYRCGVYRRKNRRAVTDSQVDQFSEFEAMHQK